MDTGNDENTLSIDNDLDDDQNDTLSSDMDWDSEYELGSRYAMGPSELWELLPKAGMIYPFESNMPLNEDADFDAPLGTRRTETNSGSSRPRHLHAG